MQIAILWQLFQEIVRKNY